MSVYLLGPGSGPAVDGDRRSGATTAARVPSLVTQVGRMEELAQRKAGGATSPGVVAPGLDDEVEWMIGTQDTPGRGCRKRIEMDVAQPDTFAGHDHAFRIEELDDGGDGVANQVARPRQSMRRRAGQRSRARQGRPVRPDDR